MKNRELLRENFKATLEKVSKILKLDVFSISRDKYREVCLANDLPLVSNPDIHDLGGYRTLRDEIFGNAKHTETAVEQLEEAERDALIKAYIDEIKKNNQLPSSKTIKNKTQLNTNKYFKTTEDLVQELNKHIDTSKFLFNEKDFDAKYSKDTEKEIKRHKSFIITTAVSGKKVNQNFLKCIKTFCKYNNSICLVLPCEDVADRKSAIKWQLDPSLREDFIRVIYSDTFLNKNFYISDIKVSAKQINPLTGLQHLTREGSVVLAGTKQELKTVPNNLFKLPRMIMTTGAITEGDYCMDVYMSKRTSKLAEYEHTIGAIIVELEDDTIYHVRQIQVDESGTIYDLDKIYTKTKVENNKDCAVVLGDCHFGEHDEEVLTVERKAIKELKVKDLVLHDIFSGISVSHWDRNKILLQAQKYLDNVSSLEDEAKMVTENLNKFNDVVSGNIYLAYSNHNTFLDRYLDSGDWAKDKINLRFCCDLVKFYIDNKEGITLKYMLEEFTNLKNKNKYKWLNHDEEKALYNCEISLHGHLGACGSRGNLKTYRNAYKSSMSAHTHSPEIYRGNFCVGMSTKLYIGYNKGLSNWVHCFGIIHKNGSKQLVQVIKDKKGKYTWRKDH